MKDSSTATERVGRYQLLEPIGGGPNGMVSRAKVFGVAGFERQFAVKRFLAELTVGNAAQALSAAARSYGSLEHPRIARMSEFGVAQGQTFTAVELVAGLDAFRLMQETRLSGGAIAAGGALALVSQAARAVGYAHGRGLSHLGLSPTNVIVTSDGDVKVTDFGILAATMPQRPVDSPRLAYRIPYLAPEQLAGEATSAATDVFVLGVIAYELVTGQRAYRGDAPAQIAQAILAGPPAEPPLPRPIVRVLQRCLARSPFERFPDARALADALDAALRVAPVPGTRKDIGAQIKQTLERYATLNEGNLSGMVALNLGPPPVLGQESAESIEISSGYEPRPEARTEPSAMPTVSPANTIPDMKPFSTVPGIPPPPIPIPPGVTPPPSPREPAGVPAKTILGVPAMNKPQIPTIVPPIKRQTVGPPPLTAKPQIPSITPRPPAPPPAPPAATPPPPPPPPTPAKAIVEEDAPSGLLEIDDSGPVKLPPRAPTNDDEIATMVRSADDMAIGFEPRDNPRDNPTTPLPRLPKPTPGHSFESQTGEMSTSMLDDLNRKATLATSEMAPVAKTAKPPSRPEIVVQPDPLAMFPDEPSIVSDGAVSVSAELPLPAPARGESQPVVAYQPAPTYEPPKAEPPKFDKTFPEEESGVLISPATTMPSMSPPPPVRSAPVAQAPSIPSLADAQPAEKKKSRAPTILLTMLLVGGVTAGGYYAYMTMSEKKAATTGTDSTDGTDGSGAGTGAGAGTPIATTKTDAGTAVVATAKADAATSIAASTDAATTVAAVAPDAATTAAAPADAASVAVTAHPDAGMSEVKPTGASDQLQIASKPSGARVFIDGADQGTTPVKLPGSADRHTMAILLPNHELYIAEVDGQGTFDVALKPITPTGGQAGIKVLKCKEKERYYVYVDGKPTGMTCPTERIDTVVGPHVVEVYDIVTETRRKFDIVVKDERLSVRVKIDN